jgi:glycosyltransferase involved in cell wall biosynthesis
MRPLKVLYVLNDLGGGASEGIYQFLRALPPGRLEAYAVAPPGRPEQLERIQPLFRDIRVFPIPWWSFKPELGLARRAAIALGSAVRGISQKRAREGVKRAAANWGIDLIHSATAMTLAGADAAKDLGIPHLWHIKECIGRANRVQFPLPDAQLVRFMSGSSHSVLVMSEYIARPFREHGCANVVVLPDGVAFAPKEDGSERRLRTELGVSEGEILVGMVASLASTWKKHALFVEMVAQIAEETPGCRFVMIGPWPSATRWPHNFAYRYFQHLRAMIDRRIPSGRLALRPFVPDPSDIMRSLDILVHPCEVEPFGRVAIEAMAAGTPVVGPADGGLAETVVDGDTGLLVEPSCPHALGRAVQTLIREPSLRCRLGSAGRLYVRERFGIERYVRRQCEIYAETSGTQVTEAA